MSGYHDGRQEAATSAPEALATSRGRGTIQRKPLVPTSVQSGAHPSGSAMPQHSLSVSSTGQDVYSVSPASSIYRDRDSHTAEHQEVMSPVSLGQQSSPGRVPLAAVSSYPQQWQQTETVARHPYQGAQQMDFQAFAGPGTGLGQPQLLPPLQRQSIIQWPELTQSSWIFPRGGDMHQQSGEHGREPLSGGPRRPSDLQLELAEARAREALSGRGPRIVSYGPAPPAEDQEVAPTSFTVPVLYPPAVQSLETSTVPWQVAEPNAVRSNTVLESNPHPGRPAQEVTVNTGNLGDGRELTNEKTKLDMAEQRTRSPFMHYEDIDYFVPEAETDIDSPALEVEQEKLKFAEAQLGLGGTGRATSRGKGKPQQPKTAVAEVSSANTPTPPMTSTGSPRAIEANNGSVGYFPSSMSGTAPADVLQMGVKARRSWERQQRKQSKRQQRHLDVSSPRMTTPGTARPMNMIMRIPSLISSAGRGSGNSVAGGGSNDNNSRNGEGGPSSNNPYGIQDHSTNEPLRNGGLGSSHSNRNRSSHGQQDINTAPHKATGVGRIPHNQGVIYPWTPEILWSLLSLATLVAIFVSLRALDGKSIDPKDWPISPAVTLNTLVALLTAICQLALVVPITQGLAQLKWNWFARAAPGGIPQRGRPLQDFALFDDAAFGTWPLAALKLLCSGKGRTLGVSACVVLLTGFLSSPFSQGAVGYEMIVVPAVGNDSLAAVLTSRAYFLSSSIARRERWSGSTDGYQDLGASQKRAIQHGIHYYTDNNSPAIPLLPPIPPQCSTPSCQFPLFSSLAVCVDTADISHRLSITKPSTKTSHSTTSLRNASLPNGAYLLGSTGTCNLNISSPSSAVPGTSSHGPRRAAMADIPTENATIAFTDQPDKLSAAIANFFFIYTNQSSRGSSAQDQEAAFSAVEVLVHFCVNTYNISVTQGVPKTELVNSSTSVAQITTGEEEGTRILHLQDPLSSSVGYLSVNLTATQALRDQLVSLIKGTYSSSYGDLMQGLTPASEVLGAALFESDLSTSASALAADNNNTSGDSGERQQHQQQKTIGNLMLNVATSLTNTIRASSSWPSSALSSSSSSSSSSSISTPQKPEVFAQRRRQITESTRGDIEGATAASTLVNGTPLLPVTAIKIHYPLMTFLTVQVLLSVAFLVGIIVQTAVWGVPVLKGSSSSLDTLLAIGPRERAVLEEEDMESEQQQGQGQGHFQGKMKEGRRRVRLRRLASTTSSSVVLGESSEMTVGGGGSRSWGGGWYLDTTATTTAPSAATNT